MGWLGPYDFDYMYNPMTLKSYKNNDPPISISILMYYQKLSNNNIIIYSNMPSAYDLNNSICYKCKICKTIGSHTITKDKLYDYIDENIENFCEQHRHDTITIEHTGRKFRKD